MVLSIAFPCKKAVLRSNEVSTHWLEDMKQQATGRPSLEQEGLSVRKFCSCSKPLAHKRALTNLDPLLTFSVITHLREMHSWPLSLISSYTASLFHCVSSFNLASSCCTLFVSINVS